MSETLHALSEIRPSDPDTVERRSLDPFQPSVDEDERKGEGCAPHLDLPLVDPDRYTDLGLIGRGGMGQVHRVRDHVLDRIVAMKLIHPRLFQRPEVLGRFVEEAQATARLQHPGIVPVHALGRLPDGRVYFTMREVRGRTLDTVIQTTLEAIGEDDAAQTPDGWSLRRLVDALQRACEAVAFAHGRGVVHRDLKPNNIMVGPFGDIQVLDWGLAQLLGVGTEAAGATNTPGSIAGTPGWMSPEQARGETHKLGPTADVYALGAILYLILCGRPPFEGEGRWTLIQNQSSTPQVVPRFEVPELQGICRAAMAADPGDRPADAGALAERLRRWLDGAWRRERAAAMVEAALALEPERAALRARAADARQEAVTLQEQERAWSPEAVRRRRWAQEDEATQLAEAANAADHTSERLLHRAFAWDPSCPAAHAALAARAQAEHAAAEAAGQPERAQRAEARLREHADALPDGHPAKRPHLAWLEGSGALTLYTDPPGAQARALRLVERDRRIVAEGRRDLGSTPLEQIPLPMGSWLIELTAPGRHTVRYPVWIHRAHHWDGVPPGATAPLPVRLPPAEAIGPDACYIPPGWCRAGSHDPATAEDMPPTRVWVDGFVIQTLPVTNLAYMAFLDDLVKTGQEALALRHAPRYHGTSPEMPGAIVYGRRADGSFHLKPDAEGDLWDPQWPVFLVDWHGAQAYAAWLAARTGQPWRLPHELEWEKAAGGVDGRIYPWGDTFQEGFCNSRRATQGRDQPLPVGQFDTDVSPYGVRDMAGNANNWCGNVFRRAGPPIDPDGRILPDPAPAALDRRPKRGGAWGWGGHACGVRRRFNQPAIYRNEVTGFRLCRDG